MRGFEKINLNESILSKLFEKTFKMKIQNYKVYGSIIIWTNSINLLFLNLKFITPYLSIQKVINPHF